MKMVPDDPLREIPSLDSGPAFASWLDLVTPARDTAFDPTSIVSVEGADVTTPQNGNLGAYQNPRWRSFVSAALFADWLAYPQPEEQAELPRLAFVMARFAAGFRVFFARHEGRSVPVGYTGWYPMAPSAYHRLERHEVDLDERMVVPLTSMPMEGDRPIYLFNYSIASSLRRTSASRQMLASYSDDIAKAAPTAAVAITVSEDGARVARRFGLQRAFDVCVGGAPEAVYLGRLSVHPS